MDDAKIVQLYWDRNEQAIPATAAKYGGYCTSIAKNILGSDYQADFLEEQRDIAAQVIDALPPVEKMSAQVIRDEIRTNEDFGEALERSMDKYLTRAKKTETRNRPIQLVEKATNFLESIDTNILLKLNDSELRRMRHQLDLLEQTLAEVRENLP